MPSLQTFAPRVSRFAAAVAVGAASLAAASPPLSAEPEPPTRIETHCRLDAPRLPAVLAFCAELVVPEDRSRPDGPQLELFVARVPALAAVPKPDPLVLIAGGPGQSAVDLYLQMRRAFEPVRIERDVVLLDQRGTGRSADGFECHLTENAAFDTNEIDELRDAINRCLAELERDPHFFSTEPAVGDLDALREALGVEQWNLYGISYGTRVAQRYAARYPERVRAMILDGVVPVSLPLGPAIATDAQDALDGIFARCAAAPDCGERFPDVAAHFTALLERLEAEPVSALAALGAEDSGAEDEKFTADHLRAVARFMSYSSTTAALLPVLFEEAHAGRYRPLVAQASTTLRGLPEALSFPMSNSVVCAEDEPFMPSDASERLGDTYLGTRIVDALRLLCARWPRGVVDADFREPLVAATPTLLLSGELDPVTPPAYAERAAEHLSQSVHLVGRGQGHGLVVIGCMPRVLRNFLAAPDPEALDAGCLDNEVPMPFFISLLGPAP